MTPNGQPVFSSMKKKGEQGLRGRERSWKTGQNRERKYAIETDRCVLLARPVLCGVTGVCLHDSHGVKNVPGVGA